MKRVLLIILTSVFLFSFPLVNYGQSPPTLGTTSTFALFTASGAFTSIGATTTVTGDVGTNAGAFNAFPPGILVGDIHWLDPAAASAATDVLTAYSDLTATTCGPVIGTTLGNNQVLTPDVYCIGAAATLIGDLILDGGGDPNALFIFKIDGALSTSTFAHVVLEDSASWCNVYWQVNGMFTLGDSSLFVGTVIANGAIELLEASTLVGRGLSTGGAISLHNNDIVILAMQGTASTISASGTTALCTGDSVILSGNIGGTWSNGATTGSITVYTAGDYFVTNPDGCGSVTSNHILVTAGLLPAASTISAGGAITLCIGDSVALSGNTGGIWSNGATTGSITVTTNGDYFVTNSNGCGSATSNHIVVTVLPVPGCSITGNGAICLGQSTQLCADTGASTYLWSTGASTACINVSAAGTYSVTVTNANECSSTCSKTVTVGSQSGCTITGTCSSICQGQSTQLCAPWATGNTYLWNTGATSRCITISSGGTYTVTVSNNGCSSTCSRTITTTAGPACTITGNNTTCQGVCTSLCAPYGNGNTYLWSTGATSRCITVSSAGTYTVTVSNNGCSSTCSKTVTTTSAPSCTITGSNITCQGGSALLCAPSGTGYTYVWNTGATSRCITVTCAGIYTVTVSNNGCSGTCSITVTGTSSPPSCTITGSSTICQGSCTSLCAPYGSGYTYLWNTGATSRCITVSSAGTYSVTVTKNGCSSICSRTVIVTSAPPSCTITGNNTMCQGVSTSLCAPSGSGNTYVWNTGATSRCITVNCSGTYTVTVSNNGCTSVCSKTVTVTSSPSCTITGTGSICQGTYTSLCAPWGNGYTYTWNTGATSRCITVSSAGIYSVTVTKNGCSSTCNKTVTATAPPTCTISGSSIICQGSFTTLCAPWSNGSTYLWSTGSTSRCIMVNCAGTFSVTVTNNGYSISCSRTVIVNQRPSCNITGNLHPNQGHSSSLCAPQGQGYQWSTGATTRCITINCSGTYGVTVTNSSGCSRSCSVCVTYSCFRVASGDQDVPVADGRIEAKAYPNPFFSKATIEFQNTGPDPHVVIELYSLTGNKITTLFDKDVEQGVLYQVELNAEDLTEGIYIYRTINGDEIISRKIILIK